MRLVVRTIIPEYQHTLMRMGWCKRRNIGSEQEFVWDTNKFGWPNNPFVDQQKEYAYENEKISNHL